MSITSLVKVCVKQMYWSFGCEIKSVTTGGSGCSLISFVPAHLVPVLPELILDPVHQGCQVGTLLADELLLREWHWDEQVLGQVAKQDTVQGCGLLSAHEVPVRNKTIGYSMATNALTDNI